MNFSYLLSHGIVLDPQYPYRREFNCEEKDEEEKRKPDLYPTLMSINIDCTHFKIDADRCDISSSEYIIDKSNHQ